MGVFVFYRIFLCYIRWKAYRARVTLDKLKVVKQNGLNRSLNKPRIDIPMSKFDYLTSCVCLLCCWPCMVLRGLYRLLLSIEYRGIIGTNRVIHELLLFSTGLAIAWTVFYLMIVIGNPNKATLVMVCVILLFIFSFGLAFSPKTRAVTIICVPTCISAVGRMLIITLILISVYQSPATNVAFNMESLGTSLVCNYVRTSAAVKEEISSRTQPIKDAIQRFIDGWNEVIQKIKDSGRAALKQIRDVRDHVKKAADFLKDFIEDLGSILPSLPKLYLLSIDIFEYIEKEIRALQALMDDLANIRVETEYNYSYSLTASNNFTVVISNVREILKQSYFAKFAKIFGVFNFFSLVIPFWLLIASYLYVRGYLKRDSYDNVYISDELLAVDASRARRKLETVFPLRLREHATVQRPWDIRLTVYELQKMLIGLAILSIAVFNAGFFIALDFALYNLVAFVRHILETVSVSFEPPRYVNSVDGNSSYAKVLQNFSDTLSKTQDYTDRVADNLLSRDSICLPEVYEPDYDAYNKILILILVALLIVVFEAYTLRLRHILCDWFYPERKSARARWLANDVLSKRGSFVNYLRRQLQRAVGGNRAIQQVSLIDRCSAEVPCFGYIRFLFGHRRKYCFTCGTQTDANNDDIQKCQKENCQGFYCVQCIEEIGNVCSICLHPIRPIIVDDSEEVDSSDDDSDETSSETGTSGDDDSENSQMLKRKKSHPSTGNNNPDKSSGNRSKQIKV